MTDPNHTTPAQQAHVRALEDIVESLRTLDESAYVPSSVVAAAFSLKALSWSLGDKRLCEESAWLVSVELQQLTPAQHLRAQAVTVGAKRLLEQQRQQR